jgi:hypothetical protein
MKKKIPLTEKQRLLRNFLWDKDNWRPPTFDVIRKHFHVHANQTLLDGMRAIKNKGWEIPPKYDKRRNKNGFL